VKNYKNDRSDASLQVDHLGNVRESRSGARPPIREAIMPRSLSSYRMVSETGGSFSLHNASSGLIEDFWSTNTQSEVYY